MEAGNTLREALAQAVRLEDKSGEFLAPARLRRAYDAAGEIERARLELEAARYFVRFVDDTYPEADEMCGDGFVRWPMKPLVATVALVALTVGPAWSAIDPPDARVNQVSGRIETVDATPGTGGLDIRHAMAADGGAKAVVFLVTNDPRDDRAPRIAIGPTGDSWVVWWREGTAGTVLARRRSAETGTWWDERVLSATGDNARDPEIVHDGTRPWAQSPSTFTSG